ncbi:hypothetical protein EPUL_005252 [Erysiphe pulchra]|uniref:Alpha/beta hydrolase fold-3 domain-containing protein n=1 Tax=Erysiphe pulchra TaxID=225359 RepID=A0A2S4PMN9_9PEZI|nr:hypothetical protein EPUL_005252 [Erysiphe pulchra]
MSKTAGGGSVMLIKQSAPMLKQAPNVFNKLMKTGFQRMMGHSNQKEYWDVTTELTIKALDILINETKHENLSEIQSLTLKDFGVSGKIWVSKTKIPSPPEDSVRQVLFGAIESLKRPGEAPGGYNLPELLPVEVEWTGYRSNASIISRELKISEGEKYDAMMREVSSKTTVLYIHGGALFLLDPAFYRNMTQRIAKLTKGRCFSVRYRLAPQNPFPAPLLDVLLVYMSLLYPPPDSYHTPVSPSDIVIAGDSAGGNLSYALLQLILEVQRSSVKIMWYGEERVLPVPGGVACLSPWLDITSSLPSNITNQPFDYLPKHELQFKSSGIWPADPPRKYMYANDSLVSHPLVSPVTGINWSGSCPVYVAVGWELLADENKFTIMQMVNQGVKVIYEEYEAMPHCFGLLLPKAACFKRFHQSWAQNIKKMVERPYDIVTSGTLIRAKSLKCEKINVHKLCPLTYSEVVGMIEEKARIEPCKTTAADIARKD